jgi:hypothetical protein
VAQQRVEQLLHGYRRGHEQLGGSVRLKPADAELVTRLSDLSGSLTGGLSFDSYLTAYPLPSRSYYAIAWPDTEAPRAGCVLTHTLLIAMSDWESMQNPSVLKSLFARPENRTPKRLEESLFIGTSNAESPPELDAFDMNSAIAFSSRFFGEGLVLSHRRLPADTSSACRLYLRPSGCPSVRSSPCVALVRTRAFDSRTS